MLPRAGSRTMVGGWHTRDGVPLDATLPLGCRCEHLPAVLSPEDAAAAFESLHSLPFRCETDEFGPQARETYYCGDPGTDFAFCGLHLCPQGEWPAQLVALRTKVEAACGLPTGALTGCLANDYPAGKGSIPWHSDEVRAHGDLRAVASLSLGAPRRFRLRRRCGQDSGGADDAAVLAEVELRGGDVLLMSGDCQSHLEHELPLRPTDGHRISLTFRSIVPGFEEARRRLAPPPAPGTTPEPLLCSRGGWRLRASQAFPWPPGRPASDEGLHGWLHRGNERVLRRLIEERRPVVVVELGSWLGLCTDWMLQVADEAADRAAAAQGAPEGTVCGGAGGEAEAGMTVFAVDPWDASLLLSEQRDQYTRDEAAMALLRRYEGGPGLHESFLSNLRARRARVFAVRQRSADGLRAIHALGVAPDLIYVSRPIYIYIYIYIYVCVCVSV